MENANPRHPNRPLKVGYALPETEFRRGPEVARWTELRAMAERAETVGFDSLWAIDRLLFPGGHEFAGFTIAQTHADGRLSVDVTTVLGGTLVDRFRASFVDENGALLLDEEVTLPIENAAVTVEATMLDFAFALSEDTVPADALIAFTLPNEGQYPHEFAVVRLPEGVTVEQVLADPSLEEQMQFIGGAYADPGETAYLGLENLEPGTYTAVCFVDIPDGIPHVMRGMIAEFTVE